MIRPSGLIIVTPMGPALHLWGVPPADGGKGGRHASLVPRGGRW
jgi:hypothetical protein